MPLSRGSGVKLYPVFAACVYLTRVRPSRALLPPRRIYITDAYLSLARYRNRYLPRAALIWIKTLVYARIQVEVRLRAVVIKDAQIMAFFKLSLYHYRLLIGPVFIQGESCYMVISARVWAVLRECNVRIQR